jgi:actin
VQTIVLDAGSGQTKIGWSGDEAPISVFPTFTGRPKYTMPQTWQGRDVYIGDEAVAKAGILILRSPVEKGIVTNWDDFEKVVNHAFYRELRADPMESPVLMTEIESSPRGCREKAIQLMFETFNVPSFYLVSQSVLGLYSSGRTTGVVLNVGEGVMQSVAIYEGCRMPHALTNGDVTGAELTAWMIKMLADRRHSFTTSTERVIVKDMKETLSYVALDFEAELQKAATTTACNATYTLPDGNEITLTDERFRCPELLFKPSFNGWTGDGVEHVLVNGIMKCDGCIRTDLYANIILMGGSTMFQGFPERVTKEIEKLAPWGTKIKVVAPPERKYGAWIGGSIFSSLSSFPQMVVTHEEYNDWGAGIVHRKCF